MKKKLRQPRRIPEQGGRIYSAKPPTVQQALFDEALKARIRSFYIYPFERKAADFGETDFRTTGAPGGARLAPEEDAPMKDGQYSLDRTRLLAIFRKRRELSWYTQGTGNVSVQAETFLGANPFLDCYRYAVGAPRLASWYWSLILSMRQEVLLRSRWDAPALDDPVQLANGYFETGYLRSRPDPTLKVPNPKTEEQNRDRLLSAASPELGAFDRLRRLRGYHFPSRKDPWYLAPGGEKRGLIHPELHRIFDAREDGAPGGYLTKDASLRRLQRDSLGIFQKSRPQEWQLSGGQLPKLEKKAAFRLGQLIRFFAENKPLGFVGASLLREERSVFRFRHHYLMKALNDVDIADLLYVLQHNDAADPRNRLWCRVDYRNARDKQAQRLVLLPLGLRESTTDGRQHLVFYHPGYRSVSALRLDGIVAVTYGTLEGGPELEEDIRRAREMSSHAWGNSFLHFTGQNVTRARRLYLVRARFLVDQPFIRKRLIQERRHGELRWEEDGTALLELRVPAPQEMVHWLQTFESRLLSCTVEGREMVREGVSLGDAFRALMRRDRTATVTVRDEEQALGFRELPRADYPHSRLFHPFYSDLFQTLGTTLERILREDPVFPNREAAERTFPAPWRQGDQYQKSRDQLWEVLEPLLLRGPGGQLRSKYVLAPGCSLWDLVPLTRLQVDWLWEVLEDSRAELFLTPEELALVRLSIGPRQERLGLDRVELFDQYRNLTPACATGECRAVLRGILDALEENRTVRMTYTTRHGETIQDEIALAYVEYSKRDDTFRICGVDDRGRVVLRNLERIGDFCPGDGEVDSARVEEQVLACRRASRQSLVVHFGHGCYDRLLNEFAPWEKSCSRERQQQGDRQISTYTMTLYYQQEETLEVAIRLLSYGDQLRLDQDTGSVIREVEERRQLQRLRLQARNLAARCKEGRQDGPER